MSIFIFKKHAFADRVFTLMLVCRKQSMEIQEFSEILQYLVGTCSIDIIAGDFSYDFLKVSENRLLDIFTDHVQKVNLLVILIHLAVHLRWPYTGIASMGKF